MIAAAAQLVQQLPLDELQEPGQEAANSRHTAVAVAALPGHLCVRMYKIPAALRRQSTQQRGRVLAQLLPAVCRLPQLLQWIAGSSQQLGVGMQRLRELTAILPPTKCQVILLCHYVNDSMRLGAPFIASSLSDAAAWANAAAAALRCLPPHELHSELLRFDAADAALAADLARAIDELQPRAAALVSISAAELQTMPEAAAAEALSATWALHSAMCQRVHFAAAASGPPFQLAGQAVAVQQAVEVLGQSLCAAALIMIVTLGARGRQSPDTAKAKRWVHVLQGRLCGSCGSCCSGHVFSVPCCCGLPPA